MRIKNVVDAVRGVFVDLFGRPSAIEELRASIERREAQAARYGAYQERVAAEAVADLRRRRYDAVHGEGAYDGTVSGDGGAS